MTIEIDYLILFGGIALIFIIVLWRSHRSRYRHQNHPGQVITEKEKRARKRSKFR